MILTWTDRFSARDHARIYTGPLYLFQLSIDFGLSGCSARPLYIRVNVVAALSRKHRNCVEGELFTNKMKQEIIVEGKVLGK